MTDIDRDSDSGIMVNPIVYNQKMFLVSIAAEKVADQYERNRGCVTSEAMDNLVQAVKELRSVSYKAINS